jgi:penicillin-binding protein 1A
MDGFSPDRTATRLGVTAVMQPISDDTVENKRTGVQGSAPLGAPFTVRGSRTAAAARQFLHALTADFVEVIQLRRDVAELSSRISRHVGGLPSLARRFARDVAAFSFETRRYVSGLPVRLRRFNDVRQRVAKPVSRAPFARASAVVLRRFAIGATVMAVVGIVALSGAMLWALHDLRLQGPIKEVTRKQASKPTLLLEAAGGEPLGRIGALKLPEMEREKFPDHLVQALLSIEDRRFYSHFGVDLLGIARAAHRNTTAGDVVEGGSTITQQLVRIRFFDRERTFTRKMREALTAIWLERHLTKDEILTSYLNSVYMGADAHGMPAAAHLYFSKPVSELTLTEAAMLAGIIRAPSQLNPLRDLQAAQARAAVVLDAMVANGAINAETAAAAKNEMPRLKLSPEFRHARAWFADWVGHEGAQITGSSSHSIRVRTTLDLRLQHLAEKAINDVLAAQNAGSRVSQAALVALRVDGAVLAMVGGRDYGTSQFNRAVEANRHPGSAFKLFVYLAALRKGYSPQHLIDAGPVEINGWEPENFGGREYGRVTLAEAFSQSINTAAVRLAMDVGLKEVISAARDLGIDARLSAVPSLALGAVEVSLLDLTGAFASVRAGRLRVKPWGMGALGPEDQSELRPLGPPIVGSGQTLGQHQQPLTDLLRLVIERGTGRAAALGGFAAGKTGTSQNHRDAWFIGFNETLVVGVWVGNDDGSPMKGVVGGTLPASIWKRFMTAATPLVGESNQQIAHLPDRRAADQASPAPEPRAASSRNGVQSQGSRSAEQSKQDATQTSTGVQPTEQPRQQTERSPKLATEGRAQGYCNLDACAGKYSSFNSSDCTYQPINGGRRRLCEIDAEPARTPRQNFPVAERQADPRVAPRPRREESAPNERRVQALRKRAFEKPDPGAREWVVEEGSESRFGAFGPRERAESAPEKSRRRLAPRERAPRDWAIEERSEPGLGFFRRRESIPQERVEERSPRFSFW